MIEIPSFGIPSEKWVEGKKLWGKKLAAQIRSFIGERVKDMAQKPGLATILVGEDPASQVYVGSKEKDAKSVGFHAVVERLPATTQEEELKQIVEKYNADDKIHGILVQLPLPSHINEREILQTIRADKDADGFHYENIGKLSAKEEGIVSCTPLGIMVMLKELGIELSGKNAVVLGRSNIVGKPMASLLLDAGQSTVTICHSRTQNLEEHVRQADILVSAMGRRDIVSPDWIKPGAIIIDVGMHRLDNGLTGDLDLDKMEDKASFVTPVPGGVGPMTRAMLLYNAYNNSLKMGAK